MLPSLSAASSALRVLLATLLLARAAGAQGAYYDLDAGRPVRVEDAQVVHRFALEVEPAPLRVERLDAGGTRYRADPHLAFGVLPRTQVEVGAPIEYRDATLGGRGGLVGLELSAMHSFNNERQFLPALALWAGARLPVGALASAATRYGVKGLLTRTFPGARVHLNAEYTTTSGSLVCQPVPGATSCSPYDDGHVCFRVTAVNATCAAPEPAAAAATVATPLIGSTRGRWAFGGALDRALPLRSILLVASAFAQHDARAGAPTDWTAEAGLRWQLGPATTFDAGIGRHFTGADRSWSLTSGLAFELPVLGAVPGLR